MKLYLISLLIFLLTWDMTEGGFWSGPPRPFKHHRQNRPPPGPPGLQKHHGPHPLHNGNVNLQGSPSNLHSHVVPSGNQKFSHHHHPPQNHHHHRGRPPPPSPGHGGHGGPPPNQGHHQSHKLPFPSFPPRFPMKTSSSNVQRQRVRPPPPNRPHPMKSFRPPVFFKPPHHMKHHTHHLSSGPSDSGPSGLGSPSPSASSGPSGSGFYTGPPENFRQSEIPFETTRFPVTEPSRDNMILPSKEYPLNYPSVPNFSSNSLEGIPPPESIGLITGDPGFPQNDSEHGWTAPNYKGWIPVARPASYYVDRDRQKHQHEQQSQQQSVAIPVSFSPQQSSPPFTSTTELYRDLGGKHQSMMLNTLFRDNVSFIKPGRPVKLKPEYSEDHKTVLIPIPDEDGQRIRIPANIFYDDFGREPEFNEIYPSGNGGQRPPVSYSQNNHGIRPYPHPANHNFDARPHHDERSPSPPTSHDLHSNSNNNLVPSHSEEVPVRKPFPKFKATFTPPSNDSSVISESLAAASGQQHGSSNSGSESERPQNNLLHRYKSKRPNFSRPRKPPADDIDEFGPPKVSSTQSQNLSIKEKINRGRIRLRGRRPESSSQQQTSTEESANQSSSNSNPGNEQSSSEVNTSTGSGNGHHTGNNNNNNNNGGGSGNQQFHSNINIASSEDNINRPPGPSYSTINEPQTSSEFTGPAGPPPPHPPPGNISGLNFPAPPSLYGGGFYGHGHPMAPPPAFYDPVSPHYFSSGPDGNYAGPPVTVVPTNAGPSDHHPSGPNHVLRAGPQKKKKVKHNHGGQDESQIIQHQRKKPVQQDQTTLRNNLPHHPPSNQDQGSFPQFPPQQHHSHTQNLQQQQQQQPQQQPPPASPFYFPNEFTQLANNDGHPSVSFMTMPGSRPNIIHHQFEFQQGNHPHPHPDEQQQLQPGYPVNIIGPSPQPFNRPSPHNYQHNFPSGPGPSAGPRPANGPIPSPNIPHHHRQKLRQETTTIRSPHYNNNQIQFGHQYPNGGDHFQRHPGSSNNFPPRQEVRNVRHPQGPRPPLPLPPPPPTSGPGPSGSGSSGPPRPGASNYRPGFTAPPNNYYDSSEYEKIPMEFVNHLRPILLNDNNDGPPSSPSTFYTTSVRPTALPPSGSSPGNNVRHTHQSPDIMPPSHYFDDFLKPFQETLASSSTERLPSTTLYPTGGGISSEAAPSFNRPSITIPTVANAQFYDSQKSPSINFAQFIRPHPQSDFTPSRHYPKEEYIAPTYITNSISSDHLFNVAPIQDFSNHVSVSPIKEYDHHYYTVQPQPSPPPRPQFSKPRPRPESRPGPEVRPDSEIPSTTKVYTPQASPYTAPSAPSDSELVIPETEITEAPKRDNIIRATHRPIYYRKRTESLLPVISSTTFRPTPFSAASASPLVSSNPESTTSSQLHDVETDSVNGQTDEHPHHQNHNHHSHQQDQNNKDQQEPDSGEISQEIEFSKPIILSSEITKPETSESDDAQEDENNIPTSSATGLRHRFTSATRLSSSTTQTTTSTTTETPAEATSFSPKRFIKRRRPGFNAEGTLAGRKKFFSSRVNRTGDEEGAATNTRLRHRQSLETQEPPVTTHRPFRRHRPVTASTSGSSEDMIVTQPHSYTRHRLFAQRIKNMSSSSRLGIPATESDPEAGKRIVVSSSSSSVEGGTSAPIRMFKRRKSTTAASFEDSPRSTTPESHVTYGESQWFRLDRTPSGATPSSHQINQDHQEEEQSSRSSHVSVSSQPQHERNDAKDQDFVDAKEKRAKEGDNHVNNSENSSSHLQDAAAYPKVVVSMTRSSSSSSSSSNNQDNDSPPPPSSAPSNLFTHHSPSIISSMESHPPSPIHFSPRKKFHHFKKSTHFNPPLPQISDSASSESDHVRLQHEHIPEPATLVQLQAPRSLNFDPLPSSFDPSPPPSTLSSSTSTPTYSVEASNESSPTSPATQDLTPSSSSSTETSNTSFPSNT